MKDRSLTLWRGLNYGRKWSKVNIEEWLESHTFHHSDFMDIRKLVELKEREGVTISLGLPTFNEEDTIVSEIIIFKSELMKNFPLIDELAIIDSGSTDRTCEFAAQYGADVYKAEEYLPEVGFHKGKGENLWKSLYLLKGDIIIWIDADITNIHPKFAYGLVGPLLTDRDLGFVKAFYERPLRVDGTLHPVGGGRVSALMIRPLFNTFFPELAGFIQPLSGEYAGRREMLEKIPFRIGYGVETGILIDIYQKFGLNCMAQVDLDRRIHRNQRLPALSKMSFAILQTFIDRLSSINKLELKEELNRSMRLFKRHGTEYVFDLYEYSSVERPPMITLEAYKKKFKR